MSIDDLKEYLIRKYDVEYDKKIQNTIHTQTNKSK